MPIFYRVTKTDPPTVEDFLSLKSLGRRLRTDTPENRRFFEGVSVWRTIDAARFAVGRFPRMGKFIAALHVPEDGSIPYEQTTDDLDHFTLWGDAADLLATVSSLVRA